MLISPSPSSFGIRRIAFVLSLITALIYFIIAFGFVPKDFESPPAPVMFIAALAYLIGGLLILRAGRRLLQIGAVINVLVVLIFGISVVAGHSTIDALSMISKFAQIGLEVTLLLLVQRSAFGEPGVDCVMRNQSA